MTALPDIDIPSAIDALWPRCNEDLREGILGTYEECFDLFAINTPRRTHQFMSVISHECQGGTITHESLYYTTTARLRIVWPSRFRAMPESQAQSFLRNEKRLANFVYGARMGNEENGVDDDDGFFYRGRGLIQCTGQDNYEHLDRLLPELDILENPDKVCHPDYALLCAAAEFAAVAKCLPWCDRNDYRAVNGLINVGTAKATTKQIVGWDDRVAWFEKWHRYCG